MFRMRPGLERMHEAAHRLGLARPGMPVAQVVGTNGKGSTAFYLSELARLHGCSTGLFTSPHLLSLRERIRINGRPAGQERIVPWANRVWRLCADLELSYFETITLVAMEGFVQEKLDLVVLEAGLGGRNDATTTWLAELVLVTPIGLDHEHVIGPGLANIARDKAGAIRPGTRAAIAAVQQPDAWQILREQAARSRVRLREQGSLGKLAHMDIQPGLSGSHQKRNAGLALEAWADLAAWHDWRFAPEICQQALGSTGWPGRLQRIHGVPEIFLDSAHNPMGMTALRDALREMHVQPASMVFTCLRDKDLSAMARLARSMTAGTIFVPELAESERSRPAAEVASMLGRAGAHAPDTATALGLAQAQARAEAGSSPRDQPGSVLACGSLHLLAEIYGLHPHWLEPSPRTVEHLPKPVH